MSLFDMAFSSPSLWSKDGHYLQWKVRRSHCFQKLTHISGPQTVTSLVQETKAPGTFSGLYWSLFLNLPPFLTHVYLPWANLFRFTFSTGYWFSIRKHSLPPQIANMFHWSFQVYFVVSSFCTWSLFYSQGKECREYSYTQSSGHSASDGLYICQTARKAEM